MPFDLGIGGLAVRLRHLTTAFAPQTPPQKSCKGPLLDFTYHPHAQRATIRSPPGDSSIFPRRTTARITSPCNRAAWIKLAITDKALKLSAEQVAKWETEWALRDGWRQR